MPACKTIIGKSVYADPRILHDPWVRVFPFEAYYNWTGSGGQIQKTRASGKLRLTLRSAWRYDFSKDYHRRANKLECWNLKTIGKLEYWNDGIMGLSILFFWPIIPIFHYSFPFYFLCPLCSLGWIVIFFIDDSSVFIRVHPRPKKVRSFEFGVRSQIR